jgi:hypothetical protein
MKDQLMRLKNGLEYMVIEELSYEGKDYFMAVQVDEASETITKNCLFAEVVTDINGKKIIKDIEDNALFDKITAMFLDKIKK